MPVGTRSKKATKGLDSDEVFKKGSLPVQVMFKWLEVERLVRKICVMLRKEDLEKEKEEEDGEDDHDDEEEE